MITAKKELHCYKISFIRNYDGDTIRADIELGFGLKLENKEIRLINIDTPELRSTDPEKKARAYEAKDFVREKLTSAKYLILKTRKDKTGKYGRVLGEIFIDGGDESINEMLVNEGLAAPYDGGARG